MTRQYQFDRVDRNEMKRWITLSASMRIQTMLDARELAMGMMRGQLRRRYPSASEAELNLKLLEELAQREH